MGGRWFTKIKVCGRILNIPNVRDYFVNFINIYIYINI